MIIPRQVTAVDLEIDASAMREGATPVAYGPTQRESCGTADSQAWLARYRSGMIPGDGNK
ncbi:hypothetical protein [Collimonas arenae]|uniref:hypothetical protein n=1 Tax=Collimonas arenae TaxID=279058 RepID=UPI00056F12BE|nr:hypothetical protein [Collimonas arenae]